MAVEIEKKLSLLDESQAQDMLVDPALFDGRARLVHLEARYYDTEEGSLSAARVGLRVRKENDESVATLKYGGGASGATHRREEVNRPLGHADFRAEVFTKDHPWLKKLIEDKPLIEVVRTDIDRHQLTYAYKESLLELALDQGLVFGGGKKRAICELEIELIRGKEADLDDFEKAHLRPYRLKASKLSKLGLGLELYGQAGKEAGPAESAGS